jgi:hypothetical protein
MTIDKKILSVDSNDEDIDLKSFSNFLQDDTKRNKAKLANEFQEIGEDLLNEIDEKKMRQNVQKSKYIRYILKHDKSAHKFTLKVLETYSFEDVKNLYNDLKDKQTNFSKILHFIFNV